ncbi:serine/threonine protein kinase [Candidatus Woesearchaeota archaeon]|nr:MAG: serine/threonine protein kinase [Candidatus Woesearchaeota archaeon]
MKHPYEHTTIAGYTNLTLIARAPSVNGHLLCGTNNLGARRAIKIGASGAEDKITHEARTLAALNHPHITPYIAHGTHHDSPYFITAAHGQSLAERTKTQPLYPQETLRIARHILSALDHAHTHGIIHCDIKPAHILETNTTHALCDFGNANTPCDLEHSLASDNPFLGSAPYMSPAQQRGEKPIPKFDLHALGTTLYSALTRAIPAHPYQKPCAHEPLAKLIDRLIHEHGYTHAREALDDLAKLDRLQEKALAEENTLLRERITKTSKETAIHWIGYAAAGAAALTHLLR